MKLVQLPTLPQAQDEAQARLEHTQSGPADIIYQSVLAGGNDIRPPQQPPRVDQGQGQQPARQAIGMAQAGEFQAKATPVIVSFWEGQNPRLSGEGFSTCAPFP